MTAFPPPLLQQGGCFDMVVGILSYALFFMHQRFSSHVHAEECDVLVNNMPLSPSDRNKVLSVSVVVHELLWLVVSERVLKKLCQQNKMMAQIYSLGRAHASRTTPSKGTALPQPSDWLGPTEVGTPSCVATTPSCEFRWKRLAQADEPLS